MVFTPAVSAQVSLTLLQQVPIKNRKSEKCDDTGGKLLLKSKNIEFTGVSYLLW